MKSKQNRSRKGTESTESQRKQTKKAPLSFKISKYILIYRTRGGLVRPLNPYRFTRHANNYTHARTRKTRAHARKYVYKQIGLS